MEKNLWMMEEMTEAQKIVDFLKECHDKKFRLGILDIENIMNGEFDYVRKSKTNEGIIDDDKLCFFHKCSADGWTLDPLNILQVLDGDFKSVSREHLKLEPEIDDNNRRITGTDVETNVVFTEKCLFSNRDKTDFKDSFHDSIRYLMSENPDNWKNYKTVIGELDRELQRVHWSKTICIPIKDQDNVVKGEVDVGGWRLRSEYKVGDIVEMEINDEGNTLCPDCLTVDFKLDVGFYTCKNKHQFIFNISKKWEKIPDKK